jgi:predicted XRE-type DNA-binding protein
MRSRKSQGAASPRRKRDRHDQAQAGGCGEALQRKAELKMATKRKIAAEASSGNVFADLGLPNSEQELMKARLTMQIFRIIKSRKLTQAKAGKVLGIPQPHVSDLMRGRARAFSAERLMDFLTALGHDVEIRLKPTRKEHGHMSVVVAA